MIRTLDASMLNISHSVKELIPLAARYGLQAVSAPSGIFESMTVAEEHTALLRDHGLLWGLMPMPADFYHWDLDDAAFDRALTELARRAEIAERIGARHAYNHVWSTGPREFGENFEWHVRRVQAVSSVLNDHGVQYGLEFLGPHELRTWQKYEFVHSLAGVLAIADAAGGKAGVAFDTFHWYCSNNACRDDLLLMRQNIHRLVAVHLNDAVAGIPFDQQKDMQRRLPMETGLIDTRAILSLFKQQPNDALYMIEPFEPGRTLFGAMDAQTAVQTAAEIFARME
ncbi:MAG: sugar phosphate isomerase/epimerase [Clostridia bacterium]|nr:sugar phosphate isomerase/epimerase [Clostridia bacterium]